MTVPGRPDGGCPCCGGSTHDPQHSRDVSDVIRFHRPSSPATGAVGARAHGAVDPMNVSLTDPEGMDRVVTAARVGLRKLLKAGADRVVFSDNKVLVLRPGDLGYKEHS